MREGRDRRERGGWRLTPERRALLDGAIRSLLVKQGRMRYGQGSALAGYFGLSRQRVSQVVTQVRRELAREGTETGPCDKSKAGEFRAGRYPAQGRWRKSGGS